MNKTCILAIEGDENFESAVHELQEEGYTIIQARSAEALRSAVESTPLAIVCCDLIFDGQGTTELPSMWPQAIWIVRLNDLNSWAVIDELCNVYGFTHVLPQNATSLMLMEAIQSQDEPLKTSPWHDISLASHAHFMRLRAIHHPQACIDEVFQFAPQAKQLAARMNVPEGADIAQPGSAYEGRARIAGPQKIEHPTLERYMSAPDQGWFSQFHFAPLWYRLMSDKLTGTLTVIRRSETCVIPFQDGIVCCMEIRTLVTPLHRLSAQETLKKCCEIFSWHEAYFCWCASDLASSSRILSPDETLKIFKFGVLSHVPEVHILPILQSVLPYFLKLKDNSRFRECLSDISEAEMIINTLINGESMAKLLSDFGSHRLMSKIIYLFFAADALDLTA